MIPLLIQLPVSAPIAIRIRMEGYVFFRWEIMDSSAFPHVRWYLNLAMAKAMIVTSSNVNWEGPAVTSSPNKRTHVKMIITSRITGIRLTNRLGFFIEIF